MQDRVRSTALLLGLDCIPVRLHRLGILGGDIAKDVGMSPHQFPAQLFGDIVDVEPSGLGGDGGVKQDLE